MLNRESPTPFRSSSRCKVAFEALGLSSGFETGIRSFHSGTSLSISRGDRSFAERPHKKPRRGVHASADTIEADVRSPIENLKPFKWTNSAPT